MAVRHSLSLARHCETHCVNVYVFCHTALLFLAVYLNIPVLKSTNVYSALVALAMMHYVSLRFAIPIKI